MSKIEDILHQEKENHYPKEELLMTILNQIPEKMEKRGRVTKSPYFWLSFTQMVSLCFLLVVVYPSYKQQYDQNTIDQEISSIDTQMESFEEQMDQSEYDSVDNDQGMIQ